jgi:hypothetical protein
MAVSSLTVSALRVTPMTVLADITPALRRYEALGFERVESGDPGCIGMQAGRTAVILATTDYLRGDFEAGLVARLAGQTVPYIHVESVDGARGGLPTATVLQDVRTRGGTREALVDDGGHLFILAERLA